MKKSMTRTFAVLSLAVAAAMTPTAVLAQSSNPSGWGIWYYNNGAGSCGYISCGENGCTVIDEFPCPNEVGSG